MSRGLRYLFLALTLAAIAGAILYLESLKAPTTPIAGDGTLEWTNPTAFLNTEPFSLKDQTGEKVVLVDFWTYSCINCQRTLPYLNAWWESYKDKGLMIVGVHTPEFEFEKEQSNVEAAIQQFGINYPVIMDNDRGTWNAFGNRYWPHQYLIGLDGNIIYDHIGEGDEEEIESEIQKALGLTDTTMSSAQNVIDIDFNKVNSPETYFGSDRATRLSFVTTQPTSLEPNQAYALGIWEQTSEALTSNEEASLLFQYDAKNVYMVASAEKPVEVEIWLDEELIKTITVEADMLYSLVEGSEYGTHTLKIIPKGLGLKLFTFTFG
jgi:thiol-disulfide isomerase/thioredoxin